MKAMRRLALGSAIIGSSSLVLLAASSGPVWADAQLVIQGVDVEGQKLTILGSGFTPMPGEMPGVFPGGAPNNSI